MFGVPCCGSRLLLCFSVLPFLLPGCPLFAPSNYFTVTFISAFFSFCYYLKVSHWFAAGAFSHVLTGTNEWGSHILVRKRCCALVLCLVFSSTRYSGESFLPLRGDCSWCCFNFPSLFPYVMMCIDTRPAVSPPRALQTTPLPCPYVILFCLLFISSSSHLLAPHLPFGSAWYKRCE